MPHKASIFNVFPLSKWLFSILIVKIQCPIKYIQWSKLSQPIQFCSAASLLGVMATFGMSPSTQKSFDFTVKFEVLSNAPSNGVIRVRLMMLRAISNGQKLICYLCAYKNFLSLEIGHRIRLCNGSIYIYNITMSSAQHIRVFILSLYFYLIVTGR